MTTDRVYFRQLLSGRDFATTDPLATQMVNFVYAIGDHETGECLVVDPAYDVNGLVDVLEVDGMRCSGVLATHYHPDHVGGSMMGMELEGVRELLEPFKPELLPGALEGYALPVSNGGEHNRANLRAAGANIHIGYATVAAHRRTVP